MDNFSWYTEAMKRLKSIDKKLIAKGLCPLCGGTLFIKDVRWHCYRDGGDRYCTFTITRTVVKGIIRRYPGGA